MYKGNEGEYESASYNVLPTLFINNNRNAYNRRCMWVRKVGMMECLKAHSNKFWIMRMRREVCDDLGKKSNKLKQ